MILIKGTQSLSDYTVSANISSALAKGYVRHHIYRRVDRGYGGGGGAGNFMVR